MNCIPHFEAKNALKIGIHSPLGHNGLNQVNASSVKVRCIVCFFVQNKYLVEPILSNSFKNDRTMSNRLRSWRKAEMEDSCSLAISFWRAIGGGVYNLPNSAS